MVGLLVTGSLYLILYYFKIIKPDADTAHLPKHILKEAAADDFTIRKEGYFSSKAWLPITSKFNFLEGKLPLGILKKKLLTAGAPVGVLEFLVFKVLALVLVPVLGFTFGSHLLGERKDILLIIFLALGYFIPELWLTGKIKKRQNSIRRDLPNVIDLLNLCVSGGLDFMIAVNRVIKDFRPCDLTEELGEVYRQTQMGKSRREALKDFAARVDIQEAYSFMRTLVQADRMGTPMADALKMQSEEMRVRRYNRGESMALKAPIKLLLPLFVFILPVVLIIVGGPIMLQFMRSNSSFGF